MISFSLFDRCPQYIYNFDKNYISVYSVYGINYARELKKFKCTYQYNVVKDKHEYCFDTDQDEFYFIMKWS